MLAARELVAEDEQAGRLFLNSEGPKIGARIGRKRMQKFGQRLPTRADRDDDVRAVETALQSPLPSLRFRPTGNLLPATDVGAEPKRLDRRTRGRRSTTQVEDAGIGERRRRWRLQDSGTA